MINEINETLRIGFVKKAKDDCKNNFKLFCETFYPEQCHTWDCFSLLQVKHIENVILGKRQLYNMFDFRSTGCTTLLNLGVIWALVYSRVDEVDISTFSLGRVCEKFNMIMDLLSKKRIVDIFGIEEHVPHKRAYISFCINRNFYKVHFNYGNKNEQKFIGKLNTHLTIYDQ